MPYITTMEPHYRLLVEQLEDGEVQVIGEEATSKHEDKGVMLQEKLEGITKTFEKPVPLIFQMPKVQQYVIFHANPSWWYLVNNIGNRYPLFPKGTRQN